MNEQFDSRPWARATIAAAVTTCGLVVVQVLGQHGRLGDLGQFDLTVLIALSLGLTGAFAFVLWAHPTDRGGQQYLRWFAYLYAAGAVAFVVGMNQITPVFEWRGVRDGNARCLTSVNLKQLVLALVNYAADHGDRLPAAAVRSPDGKPLLSWRVAILPYIEEDSLYRCFRLNEAWDSPHNIALLPRMPKVFQSYFSHRPSLPDQTYFQVFVGPGTPFERAGLRIPSDFPDGMSNTIGIIEAAPAVPWTKPDDLDYDPNRPIPPIRAMLPGNPPRRYAIVALMDGSIHSIDLKVSDATLRAAITRNGKETLGPDW